MWYNNKKSWRDCYETNLSEIMHEFIEKILVHAPNKSSGYRTQQIEIHYRFNVAVTTAVADSMKCDKKERLRNR